MSEVKISTQHISSHKYFAALIEISLIFSDILSVTFIGIHQAHKLLFHLNWICSQSLGI
jgi:hypothetical protein